jgi:hypothetical protein
LRIGGVIAGGLVVAGAAATAIGTYTWRRTTARRFARLTDQMRLRRDSTAPPFSADALGDLPPPVARYLRFALPNGRRRIRAARIRWEGEMRLRPNASWSPYTAEQHFTIAPPGFVWDADFRMIPLVPVRVRDSYVAGQGQMLGRLGGVVSVVNEGGTPEMGAGALARWLGEAVWFPTALLPGMGVTWAPVDDRTSRATVMDGATSVSAEFHFAPTGEVTGMTAMRYRDVNGKGVLTPFQGRYDGFVRREGVMIPASAVVAWLLPEGRFDYWRGRPVEVSYDLVPENAGVAAPNAR